MAAMRLGLNFVRALRSSLADWLCSLVITCQPSGTFKEKPCGLVNRSERTWAASEAVARPPDRQMAIKHSRAKGFMLQEVADRGSRVNGTLGRAGNQIDTPFVACNQCKCVILQDLAYVQGASQSLCNGGRKQPIQYRGAAETRRGGDRGSGCGIQVSRAAPGFSAPFSPARGVAGF